MTLASIVLAWYGRYHKSSSRKTDNIIQLFFEKIPELPEMMRSKFSASSIESMHGLEQMAGLLFNKLPEPSEKDYFDFFPF
ncbi:MAG: hypothetical protein V4496_02290 [Pseudomonadota bacterium]